MERKALLFTVVLLLSLILLSGCMGESQTSQTGYSELSSLIDSIMVTPTKAGKYSLASEFLEKLAALRQVEGADSAYSTLFNFFSRLHANIRITDSLAVLQLVEWMKNCFAMMDSGGVFFTNGAADTYAAWYLQRVEGIRRDLIVVSLPFLVGQDYRQFLQNNNRTRKALNLSEKDNLSIPPSSSETQEVLVEIITRQIGRPEHSPLYMAPRCGIEGKFGGHIVYLGLVYAYQETVQPKGKILDRVLFKLRQDWELRYASQGSPKDSSYAAQMVWLQYLTMLMHMVPEFEKAKRYQDVDTLFTYMEPVIGESWRFPVLRYMYCHQAEEKCHEYLEKFRKYAAEHLDDRSVQATLRQLEDE